VDIGTTTVYSQLIDIITGDFKLCGFGICINIFSGMAQGVLTFEYETKKTPQGV